MIRITIPGEPQGKGRPQFNAKLGRAYTPGKTRAYERRVRESAALAMVGQKPMDGFLDVQVIAYFALPTSYNKAKRRAMADGDLRPTRIDGDNILKACLDGMQGVVFDDDRTIAELSLSKLYADEPRVEVFVSRLEAGLPPSKRGRG